MQVVYYVCVHTRYLFFFHFIDIDECRTEMNDCHVRATCSNTFGSFECTCDAGFEGNGVNCTSKACHLVLNQYKVCCPCIQYNAMTAVHV